MIKFIAGTVIVKHFVLSGCLLYISWVNLRVAPINPQGAHYLSDCSSIACVEVDRDLWAPHARYLKSKNTFIWLWERCNFSSTSLQAAAKLLFLVGQHLKLIPTQHAIPTQISFTLSVLKSCESFSNSNSKGKSTPLYSRSIPLSILNPY